MTTYSSAIAVSYILFCRACRESEVGLAPDEAGTTTTPAPSAGRDSNPDAGLGGEDANTATSTSATVLSFGPLSLSALMAVFTSRMASR